MDTKEIYQTLGVSPAVLAFGERVLGALDERFAAIDANAELCQAKVLAAVWYHRVIAEAPHLREPYVDYAALLYDHGNWEGVAYFARCALAVAERPSTYITEGYAWGALPWDYLAIAAWNLGNASEAAEACRRAVALAPEDARLQNNLAIFERAIYNKR